MDLVNVTRKAIDSGPGAADPAVREAAETIALGLSVFAPYTGEEMWHTLGYDSPVATFGWRKADPTLLVQETLTAVVQVNGKVRDSFEVSKSIEADELEQLARSSHAVQRYIGDREIVKVIVRAPKLVNIAIKG
jgi:leucyl-tRNA synthetase